MTTTSPPSEPPDPSQEEIARALAQLENLAQPDPPVAAPNPPVEEDDEPDDDEPATDLVPFTDGRTKRVRALQAEVAEAHHLARLQEDDTPYNIDTGKVRKLRRKTQEAARLHQLAQHPAAVAYRDAKVRKVTTSMAMTAATVALAVSSIGVQSSVAKALELTQGGAGWWAAFGVEPILSLTLLATLGVQAYAAVRGKVVDRRSPEGKKLFRVEMTLLGLTLILNCWPSFKIPFDLLGLIVHSLGPIAAVLAVWVLPTFWKIIAELPVPWRGTTLSTTPVRPPYRENVQDQYDLGTAPVQVLAGHIRDLIDSGRLDPNLSVHKIRKAFAADGIRVGSEKATEIQKLLDGGTS